jgi:N-acetylglucosamine-6-phosphate deacetylase
LESEPILLKNGKIFTPFRVLDESGILLENGVISKIGKDIKDIPQSTNVIDVQNCIIAPGFIDIHLHGGGGSDTMDATYDALNIISKTHAQGGSTAIIPSTLAAPIDDMVGAIVAVKEAMDRGVEGSKILGIHLEGPYVSREQKGAFDERYIRNASSQEVERILKYVDVIKNITAAPEIEGGLELGRTFSSKGVLMSIGHSNATIYDVAKAIEAGYTHVTHLYSACSIVRRIRAYRYPGVVEAAYLFDELTTEIIADGKHLPPELIRLVIKNKGVDKVNIVTDAMGAAGLPPGKYMLGGMEVIVDEGVAFLPDRTAFAGSVTRMNEMIKVLVGQAGLSLQEAIKMATVNPAKIIGVCNRKGSLIEGKDADITVINRDFDVVLTIVEGKIVFSRLH